MKKYFTLLLVLALVLVLFGCASGEPDPNVGVYEAVSGEAQGISVRIDSVFSGGFSIELKSGGKAVLRTGGEEYNLKWSVDGTSLRIEAADTDLAGSVSDGTMVLENVLDSGVNLTLEKTE